MTHIPYPIGPPFKGIVSDVPAPGDPQAFDECTNLLCRKSRIMTRPKLNILGPPPDGAPVRYMGTFLDVLGNKHTLCLTTLHAYFITGGNVYNLLSGYDPGVNATGLPYAALNVIDRIYFCNGSDYIRYADGENSTKVSGNVPGSCAFLTTNASHIIGANWIETPPGVGGSRPYPKRVRWTANGVVVGVADDWLTDPSAGVEDLIEVPDSITGLVTSGGNTFVYRYNGITQMTPTGVGTAPFRFTNMSAAPEGMGNIYPYGLAAYDVYVISISKDDIWLMVQGVSYQRIAGGKTKKRIFADLAQASGDQVFGTVIPRFGSGFDFLSYWLTIPGLGITWVYNQEDDNWTRFTSQKGWLTALQGVILS